MIKKYICKNNNCFLYISYKDTVVVTIVDHDKLFEILKYNWNVCYKRNKNTEYFYIKSTDRIYLHHLVIGKPKGGIQIDHKNRDTTDNRLKNLRFATRGQNQLNKVGRKCAGITKLKSGWKARIHYNYKFINIGIFKTKKEAILARRKAEKKYFNI